MAKQIKVLKCPQCGSTKADNLRTDHYRCNKCGTEFFLDNDDVHVHINHRYEQAHRPTGNYTTTPGNYSAIRKGAVWSIVVAFLLLFLTIFFMTITTNRKSTNPVPVKSVLTGNSTLYLTITPWNDQVASLSFEKKRRVDSLFVFYRNIETGSVLKKQSFVFEGDVNSVDHRKFPSDQADYFIVGRKQILKLTNQELVDVTREIAARKPALESGFKSIELVPNGQGEGFKLLTNLGKELYYFPAPDVLCTEQAFKYMAVKDALPTAKNQNYYLFENKESSHSSNVAQLLRINYVYNVGGPENKMLAVTPKSLKNKANHRINSYEPITEERVYFSPRVLCEDGKHILIAFEPTLAEDAGTNVQLLDTAGKIVWTLPFPNKLFVLESLQMKEGYVLLIRNDKKDSFFIHIPADGKEYKEYAFTK